MSRRAAAVLGGLLLWQGLATGQDLEVIELQYRLASEVIPTLEPLLEPGGVITGMDGVLFVRTSPGNFAQIREAVALLDRKPRQLLISVGQGTVTTEQEAVVRGSATIGNDDVQVGVNRPPANDTNVAVRVGQRTQRANLHNVSSVRALEGHETYIGVGQSAPITTTTQVAPGWGQPNVVQTTEYRSASTGFYATVRLSGETVTLDLAPQQQRFTGGSSQRRVESAGVTTQVSGRLGEWIGVGGASESASTDSSGLLTWGRGGGDRQYSVWVRVEEAP